MTERLSSFLSEHSTEFALLPALSRSLADAYSKIVPLYYWLSREGGRLARTIHANDQFEAVALFPRRPKLKSAHDEKIIVTVNQRVLSAAEVLGARGIAAICGCPLVRSFWELDGKPDCAFVGLSDSTASQYIFDLTNDTATPDNLVLRSNNDLVRFIRNRAKILTMDELDLGIRESRTQWGGALHGTHMLMAGYKPVLVLLKR